MTPTASKLPLDSRMFSVYQYLLLILTILCTSWFMKFLWRRRKIYRFASTIRGPTSFPLIGSKIMFSCKDTDFLDAIDQISSIYNDDLVKIWIGPSLAVIVQKPEYIETLLNHPKGLDKPYFLNGFQEIMGEGLITSSGAKWKRHRKLISPCFNNRQLASYVTTFFEEAQNLKTILQNYVGTESLLQIFYMHGLNVSTRTLMGLDLTRTQFDPIIHDAAYGFFELAFYRTHWIWFHINVIWRLSPSGRKAQEYSRIVNNVIDNVFKEKFDKQKNRDLDFIIEDTFNKKFRRDFLDAILEIDEFTKQDIKEELNTFLLAGTDTTVETTVRVFILLGMHPYWQQKVYEEVMEEVGAEGEITFDILKKLDVTERVVKETLRILPIVNKTARELGADTKVGHYIIPKGTIIIYLVRQIHRNPEYWPNPLEFNPDRFLPEEEAKRHQYNYMPFSLGPRMCLGNNFAILNVKTVIATIIREFKVYTDYKSVEEIEIKDHIASKLLHGPKLKFKSR